MSATSKASRTKWKYKVLMGAYVVWVAVVREGFLEEELAGQMKEWVVGTRDGGEKVLRWEGADI